MICLRSGHQELAAKTKTARPSGRRFATSPAEIFVQRVLSPHIGGNFRFRSRHLSSPLPGCQTRLGVIPDVRENRIEIAPMCGEILGRCMFTKSARARTAAALI